MDDDLWKADGSFRGIQGNGGGGKGTRQRGGGGPQFMRVIPKFLQKYHEPPAIMAKFTPTVAEEDGGEEDELDEVQQAAMDEYMAKKKEKEEKIAKAAGANDDETTKKQTTQTVAQLGQKKPNATDGSTKKRKRKDVKALSNKKLLSFSMDDEEG